MLLNLNFRITIGKLTKSVRQLYIFVECAVACFK